MKVTLTGEEMFHAAHIGVMRRLSAIRRNRSTPYGKPTAELWRMDIESSAAEMIVGKWLGLYWNAFTSRPETLKGDVGIVQVRQTPWPNGRLILNEPDEDDTPFVLVTGQYPTFDIVGWAFAREGKFAEYWETHNGRSAYYYPQDKLYPPETLPEFLAEVENRRKAQWPG